jgi:fermentation-respiration switch protein FrsA (DUF1100 family)
MLKLFVSLAALALVLGLVVRAVEARFAFFPERGEPYTPAMRGLPVEAVDVRTSDGETVRAWWMPREGARGTVFYLHGNGGHLSMWAPVLERTWQRGYAVFAIDYRGYGVSSGTPSEEGLYRDVDAALAALHGRRPAAPVIYWGRSLGSVMAAYAAARHAPDGLILEAGFPDARAVLAGSPLWLLSWFSSYRFPAAEHVRQAPVPTLVLHGDRDRIIPFALGQRLYDAVPGPKRFFTIAGGDHNEVDPPDPAAYWHAVGEFVDGLPRGR